MPKYLDLSASVSVSMTEIFGAKKEQDKAQADGNAYSQESHPGGCKVYAES